jgi:hypothetical protein
MYSHLYVANAPSKAVCRFSSSEFCTFFLADGKQQWYALHVEICHDNAKIASNNWYVTYLFRSVLHKLFITLDQPQSRRGEGANGLQNGTGPSDS